MRVGLDHGLAARHAPGPGRYARELARALVRACDDVELRLVDVDRGARLLADGLDGPDVRCTVTRRRLPLPGRVLRLLARCGLGVDRLAGGVDLFQQTRLQGPPVTGAPEVIPLAEAPAATDPRAPAVMARLRRAARVLVFSRHGAEVATERFGVLPERIRQVPVGCDHWARHVPAPLAPDDPPLVLVLGTPSPSRSPDAVLHACERVHDGGLRVRLRCAGRRDGATLRFQQALAGSPLGSDVRFDLPAEAELPRLVATAAVVVHLAREELTPVTPLEALALGVPVVCSRLPAFTEALGEIARFVDGDHPEPLADGIAAAICQDRRDPSWQARARAVAAPFTWEANARATRAAWDLER